MKNKRRPIIFKGFYGVIRIVFCAVILLAYNLTPTDASAWVQTKTCIPDVSCDDGYEPIPVSWNTPCVKFYLNSAGTIQIPQLLVMNAAENSINEWHRPNYSSLYPHYAGTTPDDTIGYNIQKTNANIIVFRDHNWQESRSMLALTSLTHNNSTGEILDADIEINTTSYTYGIYEKDGPNVIDLQNTLTHELGHAFGLDHSYVPGSTMTPYASEGDISLRTLAQDDLEAISEIYPNVFQAVCNFDYDVFEPHDLGNRGDSACSATPYAPTQLPIWAILLLALSTLLILPPSKK